MTCSSSEALADLRTSAKTLLEEIEHAQQHVRDLNEAEQEWLLAAAQWSQEHDYLERVYSHLEQEQHFTESRIEISKRELDTLRREESELQKELDATRKMVEIFQVASAQDSVT